MPQIAATLLVASTWTVAAFGMPEQQRRELDQPAAPDDGVDEAGRQPGQAEQDQHGRGDVIHRRTFVAARRQRLGDVRIVSLLPSTTEILFAIGAGEDVVGVTFECDFPAEARSRRIVSTSAMPEGLTPAEIDAYVVGAVSRARTSTTCRPTRSPSWTPTWSSPRTSAPSARSTCPSSTTRWPTWVAGPRC